eukprot:TRINITY_DN6022_c0_g2_i1.p1 TRINITY_DN6022_c0_g2~~TRINITY_DN6022_c0_g2_i1.p1  ORF type:complete len:379 (+),score=65.49 TRINITY_DN6022_c0_g2_i1:81-1139(+)
MPKRKASVLQDRTNTTPATSKHNVASGAKPHWTEYRPTRLVDFCFEDAKGRERVAALPASYKEAKYMGSGAFGTVLTAETNDNKRIVVKMIECDTEIQIESAIRELHNLCFFTFEAPHNHIIPFVDTWFANNSLFVSLPRFEFPLDVVLEKKIEKPLACIPGKIREDLTVQLLAAVIHLHQLGIVHRDLKPSNVVVNKDLSELCVIDLGSLRKPSVAGEQGPPLTPAKNCMTEGYFPPETLVGVEKSYGREADNFAVGLTLASMITGGEIFEDNEKVEDKLDSLKLEKKRRAFVRSLFHGIRGIPDREIDCITSLLAAHPAARATSVQVFRKLTGSDTPPPPFFTHFFASLF